MHDRYDQSYKHRHKDNGFTACAAPNNNQRPERNFRQCV